MRQAGETGNSLKMVFRNHPENERIVRTTAAVFVSILDPTLEEISDFKTAVSEAVTNCIIHAYENRQGIIKINAQLKGNEIIIQISDNGKENFERGFQHPKGWSRKNDLDRFSSKLPALCERL